MRKTGYLPSSDLDREAWLKNLAVKAVLHGPTLGLTAAEISTIMADSVMFTFTLGQVEGTKTDSATKVAYKNNLANGKIGSTLGAFPTAATPPTPPAAVPAGIFKRNAKLIQHMKSSVNYTTALGQDLGIESHTVNEAAAKVIKPSLKVSLDANKPVLKYKKSNFTGVDIYVDRMDGKGFVFLATSTTASFIDKTAMPTGVNVVQWNYKIIYRTNNDQVGEFSDTVSIAITKHV